MGKRIKATTYPERNDALLKKGGKLIDIKKPKILQVGPGAALRGFRKINGEQNPLNFIGRPIEKLLKIFPLPPYFFENYETEELIKILEPFELTVADIDRRVLEIIKRIHSEDIIYKETDITEGVNGDFDGIVCFNVICRIEARERAKAVENLLNALTPRGVLIINDIGSVRGQDWDNMKSIEPGIYQKHTQEEVLEAKQYRFS